MSTENMEQVSAAWARDEQRVQEVRAIPVGVPLVKALSAALGVPVEIGSATSLRPIAMGALKHLEKAHPDRVQHFAQRLVSELDEDVGVYWGAIECQGTLDGPELVMRMLTASPAAICRAIILAMPERDA